LTYYQIVSRYVRIIGSEEAREDTSLRTGDMSNERWRLGEQPTSARHKPKIIQIEVRANMVKSKKVQNHGKIIKGHGGHVGLRSIECFEGTDL